mmetsp:Transcript_542/g.1178  ORF Transcript_542/g.1178 Transcript_542/m.1178 type:complete len:305 (-) Transcript_542:73-987(-)
MTIDLNRANRLSNVDDTSSGSKNELVTSNLSETDNNRKAGLSFGPMERAVTKRRLSEQSSSSSTETSEYDDRITTTSPLSDNKTTTQDGNCDIRICLFTGNEKKYFAELPDPSEEKVSPDDYLHKLVYATCGVEFEPKKAKSLANFFAKITDEQVAAYTMSVVTACRTNDLDALKKLNSEEGQSLNCFNRFGESLLTMACRRGFVDIVEYLLQLPDVNVRISDDTGRTILHDACWNPSPQLKICKWIMDRDPALFFIADNRGCTPFQYARPEHWGIWRQFLLDNKSSLQALKKEDVQAKLLKKS